MTTLIATGSTVEDAIEKGCKELGLSRKDIEVEILEFPLSSWKNNTDVKVKVTAKYIDAPIVEPPIAENNQTNNTLVNRLAEVDRLLAKGLITPDEHKAKRQIIIDEI